MANRTLTLSNSRLTIDLYSWLKLRDTEGEGVQALEGILGFGMPGQDNHFFEGAAANTYRGSRLRPRQIDLPLVLTATDRAALNRRFSDLYTVLNPRYGLTRLTYGLPDGDSWFVDVVRSGGGDYRRNRADTDLETTLKVDVLTLVATDPFWTRARPESFRIVQDDSGRGLLPNLAELQVSSAGAFGRREVINVGDEDAWPVITAKGPFTQVNLVGPHGEVLRWNGNILADNGLVFDANKGTVVDFNGVNRYDGLTSDPVPRFWSIEPGSSQVTVEMTGTSGGTILKGDTLFTNLIQNGRPFDVSLWATARADLSVLAGELILTANDPAGGATYAYPVKDGTGAAARFAIPPSAPFAVKVSVRNPNAVAMRARVYFGYYTWSGTNWVSYFGPAASTYVDVPAGASEEVYLTGVFPEVDGVYMLPIVQPLKADNGNPSVGMTLAIKEMSMYFTDIPPQSTPFFDGSSVSTANAHFGWAGVAAKSSGLMSKAIVSGRSEILAEWRPRRGTIV